jgi:RecA/RadA recombinase
MSEEMGKPRGYVPTNNAALERAIGTAGIPLGRVTEISGWAGAGKSTMLDQIFAATQAQGGIGVLADTERGRNRAYMKSLGVQPGSLVWIDGKTVEGMFDEVETLVRSVAHLNAVAWADAMARAGIKLPKLETYKYLVFDPNTQGKNAKPIASYSFAQWGRAQAAALLDWQRVEGLKQTGIRDQQSRALLQPVIIHTEDSAERKAAVGDFQSGRYNELIQPADAPVVIGWDSVAGTATEAELEGSARDIHPATAARVIKRNLRRLIQLIDDEAIGVVLINQRYEKIPMGGRANYGNTSETYGGSGIKYHTTIRVEVDKCGDIFAPGQSRQSGHPPVGQEVKIKVPKNKLNDPFRIERYGLVFGRGAVDAWAIHEDLKERGIIRVGGGWSRFTDATILDDADKAFRGWNDLEGMMRDNAELSSKLRAIYQEGRV